MATRKQAEKALIDVWTELNVKGAWDPSDVWVAVDSDSPQGFPDAEELDPFELLSDLPGDEWTTSDDETPWIFLRLKDAARLLAPEMLRIALRRPEDTVKSIAKYEIMYRSIEPITTEDETYLMSRGATQVAFELSRLELDPFPHPVYFEHWPISLVETLAEHWIDYEDDHRKFARALCFYREYPLASDSKRSDIDLHLKYRKEVFTEDMIDSGWKKKDAQAKFRSIVEDFRTLARQVYESQKKSQIKR